MILFDSFQCRNMTFQQRYPYCSNNVPLSVIYILLQQTQKMLYANIEKRISTSINLFIIFRLDHCSSSMMYNDVAKKNFDIRMDFSHNFQSVIR